MAGTQPGKVSRFIVFFVLCITAANASTWKVGPSEAFRTLKQAVEKAAPYDTILVYTGNYFEKNLVIKKPMVLRGIGKPVLDGEKKYELISVFSSNVTIEGFELRRSGQSSMTDYAGIKVYRSHD